MYPFWVAHYCLPLDTKTNIGLGLGPGIEERKNISFPSKMVVENNELCVLLRSNTVTKGNLEEPRVYYIL